VSPYSPIIVLDSGLGGLTVVRALRNLLPHDDFLYFGDTARLPYGSKTPATVVRFVRQIISYLRPFDPKHVVMACNTATALSLPAIRKEFPDLTISGVVDPGAKAAVVAAGARQHPVIGVIATEATVRSKAYAHAIHRRRHHARLVIRPTPLLVPIIEEGRSGNDPLVRLALEQYLKPMKDRGMEILVLGCTHYPILRPTISRMFPDVAVIDSAERCAQDVAARLASAGMARGDAFPAVPAKPVLPRRGLADYVVGDPEKDSPPQVEYTGALRCFVTDESPRFEKLASRFLGYEIDPPTWVSPDELYALTGEMMNEG
jgi:glutamate racemase